MKVKQGAEFDSAPCFFFGCGLEAMIDFFNDFLPTTVKYFPSKGYEGAYISCIPRTLESAAADYFH